MHNLGRRLDGRGFAPLRALLRPVFLLTALCLGCSNETRITETDPAWGTYAGGEEVVIRGNGFNPGHGGVSVRFGKREAMNIAVESDRAIKVTSPPGDKNAQVDVTVIFDDGRAYLLKNGFKYVDAGDSSKVMKGFFEKKK